MAKKALLVGVNAYPAPIPILRGCLNDVMQMKSILTRYYAFAEQDICILTDEAATRQGILDGLDWLVTGAGEGDVLVFHFSGHGSQVDDIHGDEWDCRDEIIIPYDHDWGNPLRDDDLKEKFDRVPLQANLIILSDSCHSGTINKLASDTVVPRVLLVPAEIQQRINEKIAHRDKEFKAYIQSYSVSLTEK